MYAKYIFPVAICLQFFQLASSSLAFYKHEKLAAVNWGLPLAGHRLNATPLATSTVPNRMKCMVECGKTKGCFAINLSPNQAGQHECELLPMTRYAISDVVIQTGWTYTGPKTKCDTNPCPNGLKCLSKETEPDYQCVDVKKGVTCQFLSDLGLTTSGIYTLIQPGGKTVEAYCDLEDEGGGWIVYMRNNAPSPNIFDQDWETYANGFGDLASSFWWGNEFVHIFTKDVLHELKIVISSTNISPTVKYTGFQITSRTDGYRLLFDMGSFTQTGNAGTKLNFHHNKRFSTPEHDLDTSSANCAKQRKAGWWYGYCAYCVGTMNPPNWAGWSDINSMELKLRPMNV